MAKIKIEMKNTKRKMFDEVYDEFLRYCKVRNLRQATIKHYEDTWPKQIEVKLHES